MSELDNRVIRCFASIFPNLTEEEIQAFDVAHLIDVDSLAAVTLVALIDDEFGVDLDLEGLLNLGNFQGIRQYLRDKSLSNRVP